FALANIRTPLFILNSAYDYSFRHLDLVASNNSGLAIFGQFHHILAPPSSDPGGHWSRCKSDPVLRSGMLTSLRQFESKPKARVFINSCFAHCQSELQDTWFAPNYPSDNKIAPVEIEGLLLSHLEILDAIVIWLPDAKAGEVPIAYVVRSPD
ncbi:hypothetical protein ACJX0J_039293, partial [Zea mays]